MTRNLLAKGEVLQVGTDTPVSFRIRKIGTETATSVTITTATNIVLVGSTTTDTIAFATYTTIGSVVDAINATGRWEVLLLDSLRAQASASTLVDGAITAGTDGNGVVCWDAKNDTSALKEFGLALTPHRNFDAPRGKVVELQEIVYYMTLGGAAANNVQIYKRKGSTETVVMQALSVSATLTTINFASGLAKLTAGPREILFIRVKDGTSVADAAANFLRISGRIV